MRVFTINSRPFAGFARRAAAPVSARTIHSPLAWLTTTGTCLPLAKTAAGDDGSAVVLSERQRDDLFEICRNASRALQHAALASDYSLSVGSTLEFGKNPANLNAGGDFALIPLVEKC